MGGSGSCRLQPRRAEARRAGRTRPRAPPSAPPPAARARPGRRGARGSWPSCPPGTCWKNSRGPSPVRVLDRRPGVALVLGDADPREELVPRRQRVGALGQLDAGRPGVDVAQGVAPEGRQRPRVGASKVIWTSRLIGPPFVAASAAACASRPRWSPGDRRRSPGDAVRTRAPPSRQGSSGRRAARSRGSSRRSGRRRRACPSRRTPGRRARRGRTRGP